MLLEALSYDRYLDNYNAGSDGIKPVKVSLVSFSYNDNYNAGSDGIKPVKVVNVRALTLTVQSKSPSTYMSHEEEDTCIIA